LVQFSSKTKPSLQENCVLATAKTHANVDLASESGNAKKVEATD